MTAPPPGHARDTAGTRGGPGRLPRQDDAAIFKPAVTKDGTIKTGNGTMICTGTRHAGTRLTAIRGNDHVTARNPGGTPPATSTSTTATAARTTSSPPPDPQCR